MTTMLLESRLPIVAAPMAGGPSSLDLGAAVAAAGAFPFLAAGYLTPQRLAEQIAAAREWGVAFGVNLFAPNPLPPDLTRFAAYVEHLQPEADAYGLRLDPTPSTDDDHWSEKLTLLVEDPVPVVSFTFALPKAAEIARLRRAGTIVLASVTTADEARAAEAAGVDGLVVQGPRAGGHTATWDPRRAIIDRSTADLVAEVRTASRLPLIAAGGVDGPESVQRLLSVGAEAVAVGTLLLRSDEAGTTPLHREALTSWPDEATALTSCFTGRPARALRNGFVDRQDAAAPLAYPAVHHLTRELRRRAAQTDDVDRVHLWAGTGYRSARAAPAAAIIASLLDDRVPTPPMS